MCVRCVRQTASPRSPSLAWRFRFPFGLALSSLGPRAKDSKRARSRGVPGATRSITITRTRRAKIQRSRSEKRSGIVMLSTSSRSRHSLSILYILSFSQTRFSPFHYFPLCVFLFFFSCVYLPLKVAGGCTGCISLNDSVIFLSSVRTLDGRVSDCSKIGRANVANKSDILLFVANASSANIASLDNLIFYYSY